MKRLALVVLALAVARAVRRDGWRVAEHDLIDHPLIALCPPLGDWLHDRDDPEHPARLLPIDWTGLDTAAPRGHDGASGPEEEQR